DYPHMIALKEERLRQEKPRCRLERIALDLADRPARKSFFAGIAGRVLVLTEGVTPYLTNDDVGSLASDLRESGFRLWITDYISPRLQFFLQRGRRKWQMRNAPFRFKPDDWVAFYAAHGWKQREMRYYAEESERLGRAVPRPWWAFIFLPFLLSARARASSRRYSGYAILEPS